MVIILRRVLIVLLLLLPSTSLNPRWLSSVAKSLDFVRPDVKPLLVGERLYLAGSDVRPVYKSNALPGIQRNVRRNHIKGVGKI
jgi:hypothetical protein